jgi:nitronate monooxygenase
MTLRAAALPPFPVQSWFVSKLKAAAMKASRTDLIPLYGGQIAPNLRHRTAPALMEALISEMAFDSRSPACR